MTYSKLISGVPIGCGLVLATLYAAHWLGIRVNYSASVPLGVYLVTNAKGSLIEFCPAEPWASESRQRGYREVGTCPDNAGPLLKPVVAQVGDIVETTAAGVFVNGKLLPKTAPLTVDSNGRPLKAWRFERIVVREGYLWVASSYNDHSYDSRYYGPVPAVRVRERLRLVFTW